MKKKRIFKILVIMVIVGIVIGGSTAFYLFNMPHRDVQSTTTDYSLTSIDIVDEFLKDKDTANLKYLASDGESKVLEITGLINKVSEDFNGQTVILLKGENDKVGVSVTLQSNPNHITTSLQIGETLTIKGVISAGAAYDEDLEMYENVILEKGSIINKK